MTKTLVRETLQEGHERVLRKILLQKFNIHIPHELSHEQKREIKNDMFMNNLKAVTAKLPHVETYSTMIFDNHKRLQHGFLVRQLEDGTIESEEFTGEQTDLLAEKIGEEIFNSAKTFKSH